MRYLTRIQCDEQHWHVKYRHVHIMACMLCIASYGCSRVNAMSFTRVDMYTVFYDCVTWWYSCRFVHKLDFLSWPLSDELTQWSHMLHFSLWWHLLYRCTHYFLLSEFLHEYTHLINYLPKMPMSSLLLVTKLIVMPQTIRSNATIRTPTAEKIWNYQ